MSVAWKTYAAFDPDGDYSSNGIISLPHQGAQCFYCHEPIVPPALQWRGSTAEIWLHPDCLIPLAAGLFRDLHEVHRAKLKAIPDVNPPGTDIERLRALDLDADWTGRIPGSANEGER